MQLFLRGIVLPFQKGKALERGVEALTPASVRLPVASDDSVFPLASLPPDAPVKQGEELCQLDGMPVVSTVCGTVDGTLMTQHPLYGTLQCADVVASGTDEYRLPLLSEEELTPDAIIDLARRAAIYDEKARSAASASCTNPSKSFRYIQLSTASYSSSVMRRSSGAGMPGMGVYCRIRLTKTSPG